MAIKNTRSFSVYKRLLTVGAALAFILQPFAPAAMALQSLNYTQAPFTASELPNWAPDRTTPSGGYGPVSFGGRSDVAELKINKDAQNPTAFYQTEGIQRQVSNSDSIKADLYVDNDWLTNGKTVRAGLWGVGKDSSSAISSYPILEFSTDGFIGWRAWDSPSGTWVNLAASYSGNTWYTLEITHNTTTHQFDYKINGTTVSSHDDEGSTTIGAVILNSKNYGATTQSYDVHWSNFAYGNYQFVAETPTNLRLVGANGPSACGGATNVNYITPTWDAVTDAVSYNYRVVVPNGSTYGPVNVGNVTSVSGPFGGQGLSTFSVQAVYADGQTSGWATPCAVSYDTTAPTTPTLQSPANNGYKTVNDFYFDWTDSTDATPVTYEFQSSQNPATSGGVLTTGVWNNIANGNAEQNHLTDSKIHSVGANGTWYWQVRAIDAAGNKSAWTPVWKMTIDMDAPNVSLTSPADNATVTGTSLTQSWASTSTDVDHYVYESFNNAAATSHRWTENMGTHTSKTANNVANATFWWRVTAYDHAGNATVSPLWKLTVLNPVPSVTAQDFGTWDNSANGFMGITAGFGLNDFSHVNSITVTLANADGDIATNTATPAMITKLNAENWAAFSSPFVVSGTLNDTYCNGGPCWTSPDHTWTAADKPTKVTATVVGKNNLGQTVTKTATNTTLAESPSYESLLPPAPTNTTNVLGDSTSTPGMGGSLPIASFAAVVNPDSSVDLVSDDTTNSDTTPQTPVKTLGAATNSPSNNNDSETAATPSTGLAWYWWAAIAVVGLGGAWWLIAARRNGTES